MKKRYLAVITARGGSKGIPKKNIKLLDNKPLIMYTVEAAERAIMDGVLDRCILSTDSKEIAEIVDGTLVDVPFIRPSYLASDQAKSVDVILHALEHCQSIGENYDAVLTLQPTSPLRDGVDIENAIHLFNEYDNDSLISVCEEPKANGYSSYYVSEDNIGIPFRKEHNMGIRRQDMPKAYVRNGAIYISSSDLLTSRRMLIGSKPQLYIMSKLKSVDVDVPEDFEYVEWLIEKGRSYEKRGRDNPSR